MYSVLGTSMSGTSMSGTPGRSTSTPKNVQVVALGVADGDLRFRLFRALRQVGALRPHPEREPGEEQHRHDLGGDVRDHRGRHHCEHDEHDDDPDAEMPGAAEGESESEHGQTVGPSVVDHE